MSKPVPVPPHGKLQIKKAVVKTACDLLTDLYKRVNAYSRLTKPDKKTLRPGPVLKTIYTALLEYPTGLYTNPLAHTEPMLHRADSLVCDCLGLVRVAHIDEVFTPADYNELSERLTLARNIVEEVYLIETRRPRPLKAGTRPHCGKATPETRAKAEQQKASKPDSTTTATALTNKGWSNLTTANTLSVPTDIGPIVARQDNIRAALDELAVAEQTGLVDDVAVLLGVLESYRPDFVTQHTEPFVKIADSYIKAAKGVCRHVLRINCIAPYDYRLLGKNLGNALHLVDAGLIP